jgi:probable HAF family extracellular repeat protein
VLTTLMALVSATATQTAGAEFDGLGDLPLGRYSSDATGVSADGSVVVGVSYSTDDRWQGFRWTAENGMEALGVAYAQDVSGDGKKFFVGVSYDPAEGAAAILEFGPHGIPEVRRIGLLPGGTYTGGTAMSRDGAVVVGGANSAIGTQAYRWTKETGIVGLGDLEGGEVYANAWGVSGDGLVVVDDYGLGDALQGWILTSAIDLSADGRVIVGAGINPDGNREAWRAVLVPEPSGWLLAAVCLVWLAGYGRARERPSAGLRRAARRCRSGGVDAHPCRPASARPCTMRSRAAATLIRVATWTFGRHCGIGRRSNTVAPIVSSPSSSTSPPNACVSINSGSATAAIVTASCR